MIFWDPDRPQFLIHEGWLFELEIARWDELQPAELAWAPVEPVDVGTMAARMGMLT